MVQRTESTEALDVARALERALAWLRNARGPQPFSASTMSTLTRLDSLGPLRITDLAELEGLTQPGMTTLINRLEESDLATRESDPADRRAVRVTITPRGIEELERYRDSRTGLIARRFAELSAEDQAVLLRAAPALQSFAEAPLLNTAIKKRDPA